MNHKRQIEEASLNAWPALNNLLFDGWILRFANGYTKRANSVTPVYPGELDVEMKIDFCAQQYSRRGLYKQLGFQELYQYWYRIAPIGR
jgi:hypothetical protein